MWIKALTVSAEWEIVVEHVGDILDVQASGSDVSGDQYAQLAGAESVDHLRIMTSDGDN